MVVFEDCAYDRQFTRSRALQNLFVNGRHYRMDCILTLQHSGAIPPVLRSNVDYIFIMRDNNLPNRRKIWEHYASVVPEYRTFDALMDACTQNYGCMVIDNTQQSNRIEDCIYWYKVSTKSLWHYLVHKVLVKRHLEKHIIQDMVNEIMQYV